MSKKTVPTELYGSIYSLLVAQGLDKCASTLLKEAKLDKAAATKSDSLTEIFSYYKNNKRPNTSTGGAPPSKKQKVESSSDESSDSDDSDDEEEEKPAAKKAAPAATKPAAVKKEESSSDESSDSSDDSDDEEEEKPAAKKAAPAATKPAAVKKEESSSDESSDSDDSDEEPQPSKSSKAVNASKKMDVDNDDDEDSSDESDEGEEEDEKKPSNHKAANGASTNNEGNAEHKIYVKGLPWVATESEVSDFFASCGTITSCELPVGEDGRSSGTAYVTFGQRSELDKALELDGQYWPGTERWLKILESSKTNHRSGDFQDAGERPEGCDTVFVGNLPWDVEEDQMWELFGQAGEVAGVRFATSKEDGSFRGFGHVSFRNGEDTVKAIELRGTPLNGRAIRVDYAPPRNRDSLGSGGGGRGGRGSPTGRGGRGGRGGGRFGGGRGGAPTSASKNKGSIVAGEGKKVTFD